MSPHFTDQSINRATAMSKREHFNPTILQALVEAALLVDVMLILMFVRAAFPLSSLLVQLLAPVPIAIVAARHGMRASLLGAMVAWVVASSFIGIMSGIWGLFYALVGVILGEMIRRGGAFWWIVWRVSIAYTLLFTFSLMAVAQMLGLGPMMLLRRFENTVVSVLQFTERLNPISDTVSLPMSGAYLLAALGVGHFLICLTYSLASCAIVSRVLHRLD